MPGSWSPAQSEALIRKFWEPLCLAALECPLEDRAQRSCWRW